MVRTGAFTYLQYGHETTFGTFPDECMCEDIDAVFGLEQKITNWNFTNNRITLAALNQLEPAIYAYGTARGSLGIDFVLSNPWWLKTIYDRRVTCDGGACCATTHTYDINNKLIDTISLEIGTEEGCTDITRRLSGGIVNSVSLRSAIGEVVRASVDISYANEAECCVCIRSMCLGTDTCNFPYTFAYGTLTTTAGTIAELQSFDITLNQNPDLLYTHNTSIATGAYRRLFEITGSFTASYLDVELLRDLYAQAHDTSGLGVDCATFVREQTTMTLTFSNGITCCMNNARSIVLTGTGVGFADHSVAIEPNEPIFETLNWQIRDVSVVATNATLAAGIPGCA